MSTNAGELLKNLKFFVEPWKHQLEGVKRATQQRDYAFFFEQGTGKTATLINTLRIKYAENQRLMRTLILGPSAVVINWQREFHKHSQVGNRAIALVDSQVERRKDFKKEKDKRPAPIFITNFEALNMQDLLQDFLEWGVEILVVDESQKIKNHKAKRTKSCILIADRTKHNFILSGTPILNCSRDIWSQFRVLDRGLTFGSNYYAFEKKYFVDKNSGMPRHVYFPKWVPREGIEKTFQNMIYQKAMRVLKKECLDLPPLVRQKAFVGMAPEQKKLYESMRRDFIAYLEDQACVANLAITKALRLQQIASGYLKFESGEEVTLKENPRLDALEEIIENIPSNQKIIIWAVFKKNYEQIGQLLKSMDIEYTELHGETHNKQESIDKFQNDPNCRAMIANPKAGGVGVNLTAASYMVYYSRGFSLEDDLQSEARNYRGGSEIHESITRIDLVATDTIDEVILEALENKLDLATSILDLRTRL